MTWKKLLWSDDAVIVRKNSGANIGTRPRLNFIEGSNITLAISDDAVGDEIDISIAAIQYSHPSAPPCRASTAAQTGHATAAQITKLDGIEAGATADQTGAEIKAAYEAEANAYTDTKDTKLAGIEEAADVTDTANVLSSGSVNRIFTWLDSGDNWIPKQVGVIPAHSFIIRFYIDVETAFNDSGSDTLKIGDAGDPDGLGLSHDVSTTGLKIPTRGVDCGYQSTAYTVLAALEGSNCDMSAGSAVVVVEYYTIAAPP